MASHSSSARSSPATGGAGRRSRSSTWRRSHERQRLTTAVRRVGRGQLDAVPRLVHGNERVLHHLLGDLPVPAHQVRDAHHPLVLGLVEPHQLVRPGWTHRRHVRETHEPVPVFPAVPLRCTPMAEISREDVAHVAKLARLQLTDAELDVFTGQLAKVLEHARDVEALDVGDVPPTAHPFPLVNVLRADEPRPTLDRDEVLAGAPVAEQGMFRVPPVLGEAP